MQRRRRKPAQKKSRWTDGVRALKNSAGNGMSAVRDRIAAWVASIGPAFTAVFEWIRSIIIFLLDTLGLYSSRIKSPIAAPVYIDEAEKIVTPAGSAVKAAAGKIDWVRDKLHENTPLASLRKARNEKLVKAIEDRKTYDNLIKAARKSEYVQTVALSVLFVVERAWLFLTWLGTPAFLLFSSAASFLMAAGAVSNAVLVFKNPADVLFNEKTGLFSFLTPQTVRSGKKEESLKTRNPGQEQVRIQTDPETETVIAKALDFAFAAVLAPLLLLLSLSVLVVTSMFSLYMRLFFFSFVTAVTAAAMFFYLIFGTFLFVLLRLIYHLVGKYLGMRKYDFAFWEIFALVKKVFVKILWNNPLENAEDPDIQLAWNRTKEHFRAYERRVRSAQPAVLGALNLALLTYVKYMYLISVYVGSVSRLLFNLIGLLLEKLNTSKIIYIFLFLHAYSFSKDAQDKITPRDSSLVFLSGDIFSVASSQSSSSSTIQLVASAAFALTSIWGVFEYGKSSAIQKDKENLYWGLEEQSRKRQSIIYNATTVVMVGCLLSSLCAAVCAPLQPIELRLSTAVVSYAWLSAYMFIRDTRLLCTFRAVFSMSFGVEVALLAVLLVAGSQHAGVSEVSLGVISLLVFLRARQKEVFERVRKNEKGLFWFLTLIRLAGICAFFVLFRPEVVDSMLRLPIFTNVLVSRALEGFPFPMAIPRFVKVAEAGGNILS